MLVTEKLYAVLGRDCFLSENEILLIALALAVLSYHLGILLLSMPIPFSSIKRWGPVLMRDSLYAGVLIFSSNIILSIVPYFQGLLGCSWHNFDVWIMGRTSWLVGWKTSVTAILGAFSRVTGGYFLYILVNPFLKMINYALTTMYSILSLSIILRTYYAKLIILGILFISVPFRLTRNTGAYFIAFSIVFMVGLQLLPSFVSSFSTGNINSSPPNGNIVFGAINIKTLDKKSICYPVVKGFDNNDNPLFLYKGDSKGMVNTGFPDRGLPRNTSYNVILDYMGITSVLEPTPVIPSRDYVQEPGGWPNNGVFITLKSPLIIDEPYCYFIVYRSGGVSVNSLIIQGDSGHLIVQSSAPNSYIEFRYIIGGSVVFSVYPYNLIHIVNGTWSWRGLKGYWNRILVPVNQSVLIIYSFNNGGEPVPPVVKEKGYLGKTGFSPWMDFTRMASSILMSWIVLPAVYLFMLGSVSAALAYLIGGSREKLPFKVW